MSEPTHAHTLKMMSLFILHRPHFALDVRTRSPEGLLFFAATRGGRSHLALYMSKGRIRLSVGKQKEIFNREKYNDGKWHSVSELISFYSNVFLGKTTILTINHRITHLQMELNSYNFFVCMVKMFPVGHIQFGEEEIPIGCRWDQSPGWSANKC